MGQSAVHCRRSITGPNTFVRMMEKMLMNMVQKAIAKQQAAENQMAIDNNNRLGTKDIENAENECNQENTDFEGKPGTSSDGTDPGGKGGGSEEEEEEEKFPWRKQLVESAKLKWQKNLIEACENETIAKKLLETRQKWRGDIVRDMGEDGLWKAEHVICALDQEHAKLISASEDELEVKALSRVTVDTHWKINLYSAKPNSLPATIKLIDECKSEDLGSIFTRFGKQWQLTAAASAPFMEVWRAECLASCSQEWQAQLVLASSWEAQARAVANTKAEPLGIALSKVKQVQEWKLGLLASTTAPWQVELVLSSTCIVVYLCCRLLVLLSTCVAVCHLSSLSFHQFVRQEGQEKKSSRSRTFSGKTWAC